MDAIGKPVTISFTAVDGTKVDLTKMQGKVVLVDFWATWCGPCVAGLPEIMGVYEKLHSKGFEIVGISFDQKKEKLTQFTTDKKMPWVQYFDGLGWGNKIGQEYGINSIPAMWLIDKKGVLRDMNGRANLAEKVEKLLAESDAAGRAALPEVFQSPVRQAPSARPRKGADGGRFLRPLPRAVAPD